MTPNIDRKEVYSRGRPVGRPSTDYCNYLDLILPISNKVVAFLDFRRVPIVMLSLHSASFFCEGPCPSRAVFSIFVMS